MISATQSFVTSGSAELAVLEWGSGQSPLLALHPGVADSRIWRWCAPFWAEEGHRVVGFDRRGFGDTTYAPEPHDDLADARVVAAATSSQPAFVVANSNGGRLALELAREDPDAVRGLVLIAPSVSGYDYANWTEVPAELEQDELIAAAEADGDLEEMNRLEVHYWLDGVEQTEGRVSGEARDLLLEMNGRALRAESAGETRVHPDLWPTLGEIAVPTLVLLGEHDLPGYRALCEGLVDGLPRAELVVMAETAHCPALDAPTELSRVTLEFFDSTP